MSVVYQLGWLYCVAPQIRITSLEKKSFPLICEWV